MPGNLVAARPERLGDQHRHQEGGHGPPAAKDLKEATGQGPSWSGYLGLLTHSVGRFPFLLNTEPQLGLPDGAVDCPPGRSVAGRAARHYSGLACWSAAGFWSWLVGVRRRRVMARCSTARTSSCQPSTPTVSPSSGRRPRRSRASPATVVYAP